MLFHRHLLQFEACARFSLRQETFDRNWAYDLGFNLHPLERLLVDPKFALHPFQHFSLHVRRPLVGPGRGFQHVDIVAIQLLLPDQHEVQRLRQLLHQQLIALAVLFVLRNALGPFPLRFVTPLDNGRFQLLRFLRLARRRQRFPIDRN